jgi:hypothetical protein
VQELVDYITRTLLGLGAAGAGGAAAARPAPPVLMFTILDERLPLQPAQVWQLEPGTRVEYAPRHGRAAPAMSGKVVKVAKALASGAPPPPAAGGGGGGGAAADEAAAAGPAAAAYTVEYTDREGATRVAEGVPLEELLLNPLKQCGHHIRRIGGAEGEDEGRAEGGGMALFCEKWEAEHEPRTADWCADLLAHLRLLGKRAGSSDAAVRATFDRANVFELSDYQAWLNGGGGKTALKLASQQCQALMRRLEVRFGRGDAELMRLDREAGARCATQRGDDDAPLRNRYKKEMDRRRININTATRAEVFPRHKPHGLIPGIGAKKWAAIEAARPAEGQSVTMCPSPLNVLKVQRYIRS